MQKLLWVFLIIVSINFNFGAALAAPLPLIAVTPTPRVLDYSGDRFAIPKTVYLVVGDNVGSETIMLLKNKLQDRGVKITKKLDVADVVFELRIHDNNKSIEIMEIQRSLPIRPDGYVLTVEQQLNTQGHIIVEGNDSAGLFYGVQTLNQLLSTDRLYNCRIEDYPEIQARGLVEGFYGKPWTHKQRLSQLEFMGKNKLNIYIYAPKDDPYHRDKWREPYPPSEMKRVQQLIKVAKANQVEFIFAIAPGLDIQFDGLQGYRDFAALKSKLELLYDAGVRSFAVFFDDIDDKSGAKQAQLINKIEREFIATKPDVKSLLTVPTEYFSADMFETNGANKQYTKEFSATLLGDIRVMYTGAGVVNSAISLEDITKVNAIYRRNMSIWWNYPANDYFSAKLALGPLEGLAATVGHTDFLVINPMEHANMSNITLQTAGEFAWNPKIYNSELAWRRAIAQQFGELAASMQIFADHSTHLEYSNWADCGRPDAPVMRQTIDLLWHRLGAGETAINEISLLNKQFEDMQYAADDLLKNLPKAVLVECQPQVLMMKKLAEYDQVALAMLRATLGDDKVCVAKLQSQTEQNLKLLQVELVAANQPLALGERLDSKLAVLSEKVAVAFLQEALDYVKSQDK